MPALIHCGTFDVNRRQDGELMTWNDLFIIVCHWGEKKKIVELLISQAIQIDLLLVAWRIDVLRATVCFMILLLANVIDLSLRKKERKKAKYIRVSAGNARLSIGLDVIWRELRRVHLERIHLPAMVMNSARNRNASRWSVCSIFWVFAQEKG